MDPQARQKAFQDRFRKELNYSNYKTQLTLLIIKKCVKLPTKTMSEIQITQKQKLCIQEECKYVRQWLKKYRNLE